MADEDGTGNNLIWAITTIIIVAIVAVAIYYSGLLGSTRRQNVEVDVKLPAVSNSK